MTVLAGWGIWEAHCFSFFSKMKPRKDGFPFTTVVSLSFDLGFSVLPGHSLALGSGLLFMRRIGLILSLSLGLIWDFCELLLCGPCFKPEEKEVILCRSDDEPFESVVKSKGLKLRPVLQLRKLAYRI